MLILDPIKRSNRSCRTRGRVGKDAIVPKWVEQHVNRGFAVLDFGSGKDMQHVHDLRNKGFFVAGYEFGDNITNDHMQEMPRSFFDVIYASNVFNTHSNEDMTRQALTDIKKGLKRGAYLIYNMPTTPRYFWKDLGTLSACVEEVFGVRPAKVDKRNIFIVKNS